MRAHAVKLSKNYPDLLDTCGTGGDNQKTFNVSTLSAIVACAAGAAVGKHGNRSVSSLCGSADLLEMMGVRLDAEPGEVEQSLAATGFGFFFAPYFHPATKSVMPARKNIRGKTIFNILGPLSNPANAKHQLVGVYEERLVGVLAEVLLQLGIQKAMVVFGREGLDEISLSGETAAAQISGGQIKMLTLRPEAFGFKQASIETLRCDSKEKNLEIAMKILNAEKSPRSDIVAFNAGAALFVADKASSIKEGIAMAQNVLQNGTALTRLEQIVSFSQRHREGSKNVSG